MSLYMRYRFVTEKYSLLNSVIGENDVLFLYRLNRFPYINAMLEPKVSLCL